MIFGNSVVAQASDNAEYAVEPYYVNILQRNLDITISGIKAQCKASLKTDKSLNLKIKMELQKEKSSGYETIETWTASKTGTYLTMSKSRNINILCDYRLKVTFTAGNETVVAYGY